MARPPFLDKFTGSRRHGPRDGLEPVLRNVAAVLNTKEGYGSFIRGFGLGGYLDKSATSELMEALTGEIHRGLVEHEPRLTEVEVKPRARDSGLWLHFDVLCRFEGERCRLRLRFDTITSQVLVERQEI